ncbi:MAG: topoisomerase DNA-binding C4 zinc finger domain-containing protein [Lachnospiraceae bacterium]|nr:topoisomerase DNA-binding C4 zinc finger domain-containing protein [Lachnospiraceae bacterium]
MLSRKPGKKLNTYVSDYVVFDLETTGVSCNSDDVVEISAIKVISGEVVDEFTTLVNPRRPIPYHASEVNGITDDMVKDSPFFQEVLFDFLEFVGNAVLVGHNIHTFDMKFLYRDAERFWGETIGNDYIDTLQVARIYLPQLSHYKLVDLAQYYGISTAGAHRALNDCRMNQIVFEQLAKEMANPSEDAKTVKKCPKCGNILRKRKGRYGEFWGCMSYPGCTYTRNI